MNNEKKEEVLKILREHLEEFEFDSISGEIPPRFQLRVRKGYKHKAETIIETLIPAIYKIEVVEAL